MNQDVMIIREAVVKLVQLLSDRGIKVTQQGVSAYVRTNAKGVPEVVNIPNIPDNASEQLIAAIQGFLDHEVGHLLYSDFNVIVEANKKHGAKIASMHNIIEDTYVERMMRKRFPGSDYNLSNVSKFFLADFTDPALRQAVAEGNVSKTIGVLMVPAIRAWSGQTVFADYMKDKWMLMGPIPDDLADLVPRIAAVSSSREALNLAIEIQKRLEKLTGSPPPSKSEEKGGKGKGEKSDTKGTKSEEKGEPSKNDGKGADEKDEASKKAESKKDDEVEPKEDGAGASDADDEKESEDKTEDDAKKGEEESESEDESDDGGFGHDDVDDDDPADEDEGVGGRGGEDDAEDDEGDATDDMGGASSSSSDASDGDAGEKSESAPPEETHYGEERYVDPADLFEAIASSDFDNAVMKKIGDEAVLSASDSAYNVFTKDFDRIEPHQVSARYEERKLRNMEETTRHMVGVMQKDLERMMAAKKRAVWEPGLRRGRLNPSALHRLVAGDDRVFRKRQEHKALNTAVSLLVDCSGSMTGAKIKTAMEAAFALSQTLERLNVPHEVLGFTTTTHRGGVDSAMIADAQKRLGKKFSRTEALLLPIFKGFNERLNSTVKPRFADAPHGISLWNNIDGESVQIAGWRLSQRKESRKVLIVLSDGAPYGQGDVWAQSAHLKRVVKDMPKIGVECVGIGIMSDQVQHYYPRYTVLGNINDLPGQVMKELRTILLG